MEYYVFDQEKKTGISNSSLNS